MTKADEASTTSTKSRRDLLTLGAAVATGAALTAVPTAAKGVISGNETTADRTIIALWAERNAIDAREKEMWDAFDVTLTDQEEIDRREEVLADMGSEAHAIERKILEQDPTTFDGLGIQATILALSVMIGKRDDEMDVSLAEWLFERFAPQELVHIKYHDRSNAAWAASHAEPDLPNPDDAIDALWKKRKPLLENRAELDDDAYAARTDAIGDIEHEIAQLEPSAPLYGMRGWGIQGAILAQLVLDSDCGDYGHDLIARRFLLEWDQEGIANHFVGGTDIDALSKLDEDRAVLKEERKAAFEARRARVKAREQAFLAEAKA